MKKLWILIEKDLRLEFEGRESVVSMFLFALLVLITFNFATGGAGSDVKRQMAPGVLWTALLFALSLGFNRSFAREKETGGLQGQMLFPIDRSLIFFAKAASNFLFAAVVSVPLLPLFSIFFDVSLTGIAAPFAVIFFLSVAGYVILGTLFSAVAVNTRMRDVMLPILLFPTATPATIAAVKSTIALLGGDSLADIQNWVALLAAFDVIFLTVGWLTFEFALEE